MLRYYNLSASQFLDYLGLNKYIKGKGSDGKRNTRLSMDKQGIRPEMSDFVLPYAEFGKEHEIDGLKFYANYRKKDSSSQHKGKGSEFDFILGNQKSFEIHNFEKNDKGSVSLSATPDGLTDCFQSAVEIKCGKLGKDVYTTQEILSKYATQIFGQQWVLSTLGYPIKRTHFVNWSFEKKQVFEIKPCHEYQKYLINELETYAKHLLKDQEFTQKTPLYNNDLHDKLELIYEED